MRINPETLKKLRKSKGFSQQTLADESGVTKKTIARIEGGKGGETRGSTMRDLAKTLRVNLEVLTQEPDSEAVHDEEVRKKYGWGVLKLRLRFDGHDIIAYDLIQDRYGVGMYDLIKVAPLLFTILSERSLAERRRRLEQAEAALENFPEHLIPRSWLALDAERASIAERDIFVRSIDEHEVNDSYYGDNRNPFNDFLIEQAKSLEPDNDAIDADDIHNLGNFDDLPSFNLFESYRKKITGGSRRADYALSRGYVRISEIPEELRGEDESVTAERVKRLESKVKDEEWIEYEERMRPLREAAAKVIDKSLNEGDTENA